MKDYYKILGVSEQSTEKEIKAAYRKLAKRYHPDEVHGDTKKEAQMYEIQEAYHCLGDTQKRKTYDEARLKPSPGKRPIKAQQPFNASPDMSQFEQFFKFRPGKGMETYQDKGGGTKRPEGPIKPEEMFASFFGKTGQKGGKQ